MCTSLSKPSDTCKSFSLFALPYPVHSRYSLAIADLRPVAVWQRVCRQSMLEKILARVDVDVDAWMVQGTVHVVRADFTCQEAKNEVECNIFQGRQL